MNNLKSKLLAATGLVLILLGFYFLKNPINLNKYSKGDLVCVQPPETLMPKFTLEVLASYEFENKTGYVVSIIAPIGAEGLTLIPEEVLETLKVDCKQ